MNCTQEVQVSTVHTTPTHLLRKAAQNLEDQPHRQNKKQRVNSEDGISYNYETKGSKVTEDVNTQKLHPYQEILDDLVEGFHFVEQYFASN
jgi:hypothetical protein